MLETIAFILFVLWFVGLVSSYTLGGFIHGFLVVAMILFSISLNNGRRPPM